MRVLFVGEGAHDIGHDDPSPNQPRQAGGVLFALARRVCPKIDEDSLALKWTDIARFDPSAKRAGFEKKIKAAAVLAERKFDCVGTICIADQDGRPDRLAEMLKGRDGCSGLVSAAHHIICALAVESIEAWTLGSPTALAAVLGEEMNAIQGLYHVSKVESFKESSGKEEHRPKALLQRVADLGHRESSTQFRIEVAEKTDLAELERNCKEGFKPFIDQLRAAFG